MKVCLLLKRIAINGISHKDTSIARITIPNKNKGEVTL